MSTAEKTLTPKQKEIFDFIVQESAEVGCVPSQAEIQRHFGHKSPNATRQNLKLIEKKGFIEILPGISRGIRILKPESIDLNMIPLVGRIAAGNPILAEENIEEWLKLPEALFPVSEDRFALRVEGDSMINAGIMDRDVAIISKCAEPNSGAIAAVRIGDEATLKRIHFFKGGLRLEAENPNYPPIKITASSGEFCTVEGVLEGILRTYPRGGHN